MKATFTSESRARSLSSSTFAFKASSFQGKCGTVVSYKHSKMDIFVNILWEHKGAPQGYQQFTFLANEEPKFMIECQPHRWSLPSASSNFPEESHPQKTKFGKYELLEASSCVEDNPVYVEEGHNVEANEDYQHGAITKIHTVTKAALQNLVLRPEHQKSGPSRRAILKYMFVNFDERQKNKNLVFAALEKMVDSKELILTSTTGIPCYKLYENTSNTTCCYCGKELSLTVSSSASVTFEKNFHKQAYCANPQAISNHYTNIIKSAIQCIIHSSKKNHLKKRGPHLSILY